MRTRHLATPDLVHTEQTIADDLVKLGVHAAQTVLIHASMRAMGRIEGGAPSVVAAIKRVIGPTGTLVVPAGTSDNSDSSRAYLAKVKEMTADERNRYRAAMPAFDPAVTPSFQMGSIAETVRTSPGAVRSTHPQTSFAAIGRRAYEVTAQHSDDCHLGERSPLARLYDINGAILLIGVGYETCSALHLAEYRYTTEPPPRVYGCVITRNGRRVWWHYTDVDLDDSDFVDLGNDLDNTGIPTHGKVAQANCVLLPFRATVDFAVQWFRLHRTAAHLAWRQRRD